MSEVEGLDATDAENSTEAGSHRSRPLQAALLLSIATGLALAVWTWRLNFSAGEIRPLIILTLDFSLIAALLLTPLVLLEAFFRNRFGWEVSLASSLGAGVAGLFFLLWFVRMEPAHQFVSREPHLSLQGLVALSVLAITTILIYVTFGFVRGARRWLTGAAAVAGSSVCFLALADFQTPERSRDHAVQELSRSLRYDATEPVPGSSEHHRVLLIGIDGMDWNVVYELIRQGSLPAIERLLREGQYYQLDNLEMKESAAIWTSVYTGVAAPASGIEGFVLFRFRGIEAPIIALPRFGFHPVLYLKEILWNTRWLGLWERATVSNSDFASPPLWTILSESGREVAVIEPLPVTVIPERIRGLFAAPTSEGLSVFDREGRRNFAFPKARTHSAAQAILEERSRRSIACGLVPSSTHDVAIYYTHFLDTLQHLEWLSLSSDGVFRGDPSRGRSVSAGDNFRIRDGYIEADRTIAELRRCFGEPATIFLVSDHGWDYSDHEHFFSPHGMLVISPGWNRGYGGLASVLQIAPTFLEAAGVAPDSAMEAALEVGFPRLVPQDWTALPRELIEIDPGNDRLERLKSLGYIGG